MDTKVVGGANLLVSLWALMTLFRVSVFSVTTHTLSISDLMSYWYIFPLFFIFLVNMFLGFLMFLKFDRHVVVMISLTMLFSSFLFLNYSIDKVNTMIRDYSKEIAAEVIF